MKLTAGFKRYFERLRRSGVCNMYEAAPYLVRDFNISIDDARNMLLQWMQTYDPKDPDYANL